MPHLPSLSTSWFRVVLLWVCGVVAALQLAKISVAFDSLQAHYGASAASLGGVLSAMGVVGMVGGVAVGLLAPRWGLVRVLVGGLVLGAAVSVVQSRMLPLPWFWLSRLVEGASHLAVVVTAPTLMVHCSAPQHRAVVMGVWGTFVAAAYVLAGALAPYLLVWGVGAWFGLHAVLMLLSALVAALVLRGTPVHRELGVAPWRGLVVEHQALYGRAALVLPALCFFCYTSMALAFMTFLPLVCGSDRAWVMVALPVCGVLGTLAAGVAAQRWGQPLRMVRLAYVGVGLMAGLLGWHWLQGGWLGPWALALMFCTGLAAGSALALVPALNPAAGDQARANGAVAQWGNLGAACTGPVFGWAWPQGAVVVCALIGVYCTLGIGLAVWGQRHFAPPAHG